MRYHYYRHVRGHRGGVLPDGTSCRAFHRVEAVDDIVRRRLVDFATSPDARTQVLRQMGSRGGARPQDARRRELLAQLEDIHKQQARLLGLYLAGDFDRRELDRTKAALLANSHLLEEEIAAVEARLEPLRRDGLELVAETFAAAADLASMTFAQQQVVVHGLVERVNVSPGGGVVVVPKFQGGSEQGYTR